MQSRKLLSAGFRQTFSRLSQEQPAAQQIPKVKKLRTSTIFVKDIGNTPILVANAVGATALVTFGLRKLFFHPDVAISEINRFNDPVQNETAQRLESSHAFRAQTRMFANFLVPISSRIISLVSGTKQGYGDENDIWALSFIREREVMEPSYENTNAFDDGLFADVEPSDFAKNEIDHYGKTQI